MRVFFLGNLSLGRQGLEPRPSQQLRAQSDALTEHHRFLCGHLREGGSHLIGQNCGDSHTLEREAGGRAEHRPKSQVDSISEHWLINLLSLSFPFCKRERRHYFQLTVRLSKKMPG